MYASFGFPAESFQKNLEARDGFVEKMGGVVTLLEEWATANKNAFQQEEKQKEEEAPQEKKTPKETESPRG